MELSFFALIALLWSVHPLRTEVVCWVTERKELASVFFTLLALLAYVRNRYWPSVVLAALAMMAKPVAVTIPAIVLAWDWVLNGKARPWRLAPFVLFSAFTCLMTMRAQTCALEIGQTVSIQNRLTCILGAPVVYLKQTVWPVGLSMLYGGSQTFDWVLVVGGGCLVLAMAAVGAWWFVRRDRLAAILAFGIAWAYVGLVPMLGIVKVAAEEHSDRYTYYVGCGIAALAALLAEWAAPRLRAIVAADEWARLKKGTLAVLALCVVVLFVMSGRQARCWRNGVTLYRDIMAKTWNPQIAVPLGELLVQTYGEKGYEEAERWLRECAGRAKCPESYFALGRILLKNPNQRLSSVMGDGEAYVEAELVLREVLAMKPEHAEAKELLAWIDENRRKMKGK